MGDYKNRILFHGINLQLKCLSWQIVQNNVEISMPTYEHMAQISKVTSNGFSAAFEKAQNVTVQWKCFPSQKTINKKCRYRS